MANILLNSAAAKVNFNPVFRSPLDGRLVVQYKSDLTDIYTISGEDGLKTAYAGMVVTVASENKTYILKSDTSKNWMADWPTAADPHEESNWVLASNVTQVVDYLKSSDVLNAELVESHLGVIYCVTKGKVEDDSATGDYPIGMYTVVKNVIEGNPVYSIMSLLPDVANNTDMIAVKNDVANLKLAINGNGKEGDEKVPGLIENMNGAIDAITALDDTVNGDNGLVSKIETIDNALNDEANGLLSQVADLNDKIFGEQADSLASKIETIDNALNDEDNGLAARITVIEGSYLPSSNSIPLADIEKLFTTTKA